MQIVVQNEDEKKLLEAFLHDQFINQKRATTFKSEGNDISSLTNDEMRLIKHSFEDLLITVEPSVEEMSFSKGDIISHVFECSKLNNESEIVTYSHYLAKQSKEMIKPWEHNSCWNEDVLE